MCRNNMQCLEAVLRGPISAYTAIEAKSIAGKSRNSRKSRKLRKSAHSYTLITLNKECRCSSITRFVANVFDFLGDCTNWLWHCRLCQFFVRLLSGFYSAIGYFGRGFEELGQKMRCIL